MIRGVSVLFLSTWTGRIIFIIEKREHLGLTVLDSVETADPRGGKCSFQSPHQSGTCGCTSSLPPQSIRHPNSLSRTHTHRRLRLKIVAFDWEHTLQWKSSRFV